MPEAEYDSDDEFYGNADLDMNGFEGANRRRAKMVPRDEYDRFKIGFNERFMKGFEDDTIPAITAMLAAFLIEQWDIFACAMFQSVASRTRVKETGHAATPATTYTNPSCRLSCPSITVAKLYYPLVAGPVAHVMRTEFGNSVTVCSLYDLMVLISM